MRLGSLTALLVACSGGDDTATPCSLPPLTTPESGFFTDISDSSGMRVDNFYGSLAHRSTTIAVSPWPISMETASTIW